MSFNKLFLPILILFFFASCTSKERQNTVNHLEYDKVQREKVLNQFKSKLSFLDESVISKLILKLHSDSNLLWSDGKTLNNNALELKKHTENAHKYGLDSSFYPMQTLHNLYTSLLKDTGNIALLVQAELTFSQVAIQYFSQIKYGFLNQTDKDSIYYQLKYDSLSDQDFEIIRKGIKSNQLQKIVDTLEPQFIGYKLLQQSWSNFVDNRIFGFDNVVVSSMKDDSVSTYQKVKKALLFSGFIDSTELDNDSIFMERIKQFQIHHGLNSDGRVGIASAYALSRSNADRRLSVMTTMENYKQEKFDEDSLLFINIPSYMLRIIEQNKIAHSYRAVVGKTINRTPTFSANMDYLVLNPYWHIPYSISSKEILPNLQKDSNLASKKGYTIYDKNKNKIDASSVDWSKVSTNSFDYRISQTRSGATALGSVKFIFTNKYSIYLHDTPSKSLFKNDERAYSHGCIRIQNPLNLATYLISRMDSEYTQDSLENFVKTGIQKRIDLSYPLKVSIRYFSCEGTPEGNIIFYRDIYTKESMIKSCIEKLIYSKSE